MFFYNIFIFIYSSAINLAALWNPKAARWVEGRKGWRKNMEGRLHGSENKKKIWMHCASLGEFEQGRPLIEVLRKEHPDAFIYLSFFSPSGYEIRKNYPLVNGVGYLPIDNPRNAIDFIDILKPDLAIFIKYEYWLHYLTFLHRNKVPVIMVSAIFRDNQYFFRWYGKFARDIIAGISHFFVQTPYSAELLTRHGITQHTVAGDTRFDRVISVADAFERMDTIEKFCGNAMVIVAGSTWEEDEETWDHFANVRKDIRFIIAPHEIYDAHLRTIEKLFTHAIRYSAWPETGSSGNNANVMIIDNIGMLSRLYRYADICYVGGGFGAGIHNILEAAVYGKPVVFGHEYEKFREATDLVDMGGAISIASAIELEKKVAELLGNAVERKRMGDICGNYVKERAGATQIVLRYIQENLRLTS